MNRNHAALASLMYVLLPFTAPAASLPGSMSDDSMLKAASLPRVSVGVAVEILDRNVQIDNRTESELQGDAYYGYLGVDALRWLTLFGTIGAATLDSLNNVDVGGSYDPDLRWSVGLNANLWHVDLKEPEFMRGRLSLGFNAEYVESKASRDEFEVSWQDMAFALPIAFEIPNDPMVFMGVTSLLLYAGPAYSTVTGDYNAGGPSLDLEQDNEMGVLAGADIYMAPNVIIGASMLYVDQASFTFSARYHF